MPDGSSAESAGESLHEPAPSVHTPEADAPIAQAPTGKQLQRRQLWMWIGGGVLLLLALYEAIPWAITAFRTESTDDAYVNGHVTFVAPRVPGQVVRVLVDDNNRVRKGSLLVQLDKEPYQVKVEIAQAALSLAQTGIVTAQTKVRGLESRRSANGSIWQMRCTTSTTRSPTCTQSGRSSSRECHPHQDPGRLWARAAAIPAAGYIKS